jgi:small conductance mechanosensitive channel
MNLSDLTHWLRGSALEVVLIVTGSVLLVRFAHWGADRLAGRLERSEEVRPEENIVASEARKHRRALLQLGAWTTTAVVFVVAVLLVFERLNVPLSSFLAPATILGAAIGFGAQTLVRDLLAGVFIFGERQYGYGDVIRVSPPGEVTGISGTVEEVTLRATRLRTEDGELVILPNGEIRQLTNLSKDWAQAVLDIPLATDADIARATDILHRIAEEIVEDDEWAPLLLDQPTVMGIQRFAVGYLHLRFVARTLPGKQWSVARELRGRIVIAFREAGIAAPEPTIPSTGAAGP